MIRKMTVTLDPPYDESELRRIAERDSGCVPAHFALLRKSIDARHINRVRVQYTFEYGDKSDRSHVVL